MQALTKPIQVLDGETIREWMHPAYMYRDGTGYGHPWELVPTGNYTLQTKPGNVPGYATLFSMAVSDCVASLTVRLACIRMPFRVFFA